MSIYNGDIKLVRKKNLSDLVIELDYEVPGDLDFLPGQFVTVVVDPPIRRSYSILDVQNNIMKLWVNIEPGGVGSKYFEKTDVGDSTQMLGPLGNFVLQDTDYKKIFIATGTGIVPFYPMLKHLNSSKPDVEVDIFMGSRCQKFDFARDLFSPFLNENVRYFSCLTQPEDDDMDFETGRVTEVVPKIAEYDEDTEFYLCGATEMVVDMEKVLLGQMGVSTEKIFYEKYG